MEMAIAILWESTFMLVIIGVMLVVFGFVHLTSSSLEEEREKRSLESEMKAEQQKITDWKKAQKKQR